jgi:SAM-dependent methyltransferase
MTTHDTTLRPAASAGAPVRAFRVATPENTRPAPLSHAARRVRDVLGIPIAALPGLEAQDAVYVHDHTRTLNELIDGRPAVSGAWKVLGAAGAPEGFERLGRQDPPAFPALWERGEVPAIEAGGLGGVERTWRERSAAHPLWSRAAGCVRAEPEYAQVWREILGGDFDVTGRGVEYTAGMEVFQASRWFGARTLLSLLGAHGGEGVYLDVLGGDGYVWRLLEAEKCAAEPRLVMIEGGALPAGVACFDALPHGVARAAAEVFAAAPEVAVLVVGDGPAAGEPFPALLLRRDGDGVALFPLALGDADLARLSSLGEARWHAAGEPFAAARPTGGAVIVTNDLSPHMFTRAGAWGFPTREDATLLSRTFHDASVDGVLVAYGTHHIPDMQACARESFRVVRPGAPVVMHDFFDEGPAGQWFHRIVDERSITGHDFPHVGPVQMAAVLLRAGFRDVRLYEIQDPFLFACDEDGSRARDLALGYISGMYGLAPGFPDGLGELEDAIREILTYPEVGEEPVFADGFVYIPRRAVVARAVRPERDDQPYSAQDLALVRALASVLRRDADRLVAWHNLPEEVHRYWFKPDGSYFGIPAEQRLEWVRWADALLRKGSADGLREDAGRLQEPGGHGGACPTATPVEPREASRHGPPVEVRVGKLGRGVFARRRIDAGDEVLSGWGEKVERSIHSFQVGPDTHVRIRNEIELINHSCEPNCGILLPLDATELRVVALRVIEPGEELTTDYATHDYEIRFMPERCSCGSPLCRGRITGYRDLPAERRAAYGRHVAAYLPLLEAASTQPTAAAEAP